VSLLAVAAVLLSWQVATDAFPVSMDDEVAFIDDAAPKKTAAQKIAAAQVKESKAEVARARAIVEGRDPNASGGAGAMSATASASNGGVASPASVSSSLKTSKIVKQKNANTVNPRSLVTHKVPIGKEGWRQDQGARKINTADYELEKIKRHLGFQRQERYAESRRAYRLWHASERAAKAAANMATSIRKEALSRASRAVQRVQKLQSKLGTTKGHGRANIQMELAKAKVGVTESHAYAIKAGKAANSAIMKVATLEGDAKAKLTLARQADTSTRIERAMEQADKAKLALKTFDKNTRMDNKIARVRRHNRRVRRRQHAAYMKKLGKLKHAASAANKAARQKAFHDEIIAANKSALAKLKFLHSKKKSGSSTASPVAVKGASKHSSSVQQLIQKAHATGKSADVKAAAAATRAHVAGNHE